MHHLRLLSLLCLLALSLLPAAAQAQEPTDLLSIRADPWMPYNGDPEADKPGFMIEIVRAIYEPRGIAVDYQLVPWARALEMAKSGEVGAVIGAGEDRAPNFVFPQEEVGYSGGAWTTHADSDWTFVSLDSLTGYRLGNIADYTNYPELDAYVARHEDNADRVVSVKGTDALSQLMRMLLAKRIDVLYGDPAVLLWEAKQQGVVDKVRIATLEQPKAFEKVYLGLSKKRSESPALAAIFDQGIRELRASGELDRILARYGQTDWKELLPK